MVSETMEPEFSRPFRVERLGAEEAVEALEANAQERAALARRLGLPALDHLAASIRLKRDTGGLIRVNGRLEAKLAQTCVVTLEPFPSHVEDSFEATFGDSPRPDPNDVILDPDDDLPEPVEAGTIDLGELVAQYLSLALDPYPRSPGAALDQVWSGGNAGPETPFAVLRQLKNG